jgi:ParB/RepB/Spo0J family partition protein
MTFSHSFSVPLDQIFVDRPARQRREISVDSLVHSIRLHGIMNPLIVGELSQNSEPASRGFMYFLVAGERRLTAADQLGLSIVPVRLRSSLSFVEAHELELEENIRREDLTWQEACKAVADLHQLYCSRAEVSWSQQKTADALGFSVSSVTQYIRVAKELHDPKIAAANTMRAAYDVLTRRDSRLVDDAISELLEVPLLKESKDETIAVAAAPGPGLPASTTLPQAAPKAPASPGPAVPPVAAQSILHEDFLKWAASYRGPKFNLIHCDFPYGVNAFGGGSNAQHSDVGYEDSPDIYWKLMRGFCATLENFTAHSAHIIFWYSPNWRQETLAFFRKHAPSIAWDAFDLVWHKSDNTGMVPDPSRSPRRTYEVALFGAREDRKIIRPLANSYAAPTDKTHHPSAKPVPVLKHFFGMLVDNGTRMLDPTCGGASSLRAADALGAKEVFGLELDKDHYETATRALRTDRALRGNGK